MPDEPEEEESPNFSSAAAISNILSGPNLHAAVNAPQFTHERFNPQVAATGPTMAGFGMPSHVTTPQSAPSSSNDRLLQLIHQSLTNDTGPQHSERQTNVSSGGIPDNEKQQQLLLMSLGLSNAANANPGLPPGLSRSASRQAAQASYQDFSRQRQQPNAFASSRQGLPVSAAPLSPAPSAPPSQQQQISQLLQQLQDQRATESRSGAPSRSSTLDSVGRVPSLQRRASQTPSRSLLQDTLGLINVHGSGNQGSSHGAADVNDNLQGLRRGHSTVSSGTYPRNESSSSLQQLMGMLGESTSSTSRRPSLRGGTSHDPQDRLNEILLEELCAEASRLQRDEQQQQQERERQEQRERHREREWQEQQERQRRQQQQQQQQQQQTQQQQGSLELMLRQLGQQNGMDLSQLLSSSSHLQEDRRQQQIQASTGGGGLRNASFSLSNRDQQRQEHPGVHLSSIFNQSSQGPPQRFDMPASALQNFLLRQHQAQNRLRSSQTENKQATEDEDCEESAPPQAKRPRR